METVKGRQWNSKPLLDLGDKYANELVHALQSVTGKSSERNQDLNLTIVSEELSKKVCIKVTSDELAALRMLLSRPFADSADISLIRDNSNCLIPTG